MGVAWGRISDPHCLQLVLFVHEKEPYVLLLVEDCPLHPLELFLTLLQLTSIKVVAHVQEKRLVLVQLFHCCPDFISARGHDRLEIRLQPGHVICQLFNGEWFEFLGVLVLD